jgi:hypothetical protein
MHTWMLAVVVAAGFAAGCHATTPVEFCDSYEVEVCAREFECWDAATKMSSEFVMHYGTTVAECETRLKTNDCGATSNDQPCAVAGKTYHADKADACVADLKAASCTTITAPAPNNFVSSNCQTVCS